MGGAGRGGEEFLYCYLSWGKICLDMNISCFGKHMVTKVGCKFQESWIYLNWRYIKVLRIKEPRNFITAVVLDTLHYSVCKSGAVMAHTF